MTATADPGLPAPEGSGAAWRLPLLGATAGALSGLLGIGGGLVVGPVLILQGLPPKRAFGSALAVVFPVACVAVLAESLLQPANLHVIVALALAAGGQLGARLGDRWMRRLPEHALRLAFVALVLWAALRNLGWIGELPAAAQAGLSADPAARLALCVLLGVAAGVCAVLFGVGGGVVMVPGLVLLAGGFPMREAMGTSLLAMVPTAAAGLWAARRAGRVEPSAVRRLMLPALLGAVAGVALRTRAVPADRLAQLFGAFLLFVAWQLLRRGAARDRRSPRRS